MTLLDWINKTIENRLSPTTSKESETKEESLSPSLKAKKQNSSSSLLDNDINNKTLQDKSIEAINEQIKSTTTKKQSLPHYMIPKTSASSNTRSKSLNLHKQFSTPTLSEIKHDDLDLENEKFTKQKSASSKFLKRENTSSIYGNASLTRENMSPMRGNSSPKRTNSEKQVTLQETQDNLSSKTKCQSNIRPKSISKPLMTPDSDQIVPIEPGKVIVPANVRQSIMPVEIKQNLNQSRVTGFKWGYSNTNGPHTWALHFPNAGGSRQSPIMLANRLSKLDKSLKNLRIQLWDCQMNSITNTGRGVIVDICNPEKGKIEGGPLNENNNYQILNCHFHWGSCNQWGSEHHLNGKAFSAELHFPFWDCKNCNSQTEAYNHDDGLCVLAVFIKIGNQNKALQPMIEKLKEITYLNNTAILSNHVDLNDLLPANLGHYFTYAGSITTPPCSECVTWIVLRDPIEISDEQINAFRQLYSGEANSPLILENFRPLCFLGGDRTLRRSF